MKDRENVVAARAIPAVRSEADREFEQLDARASQDAGANTLDVHDSRRATALVQMRIELINAYLKERFQAEVCRKLEPPETDEARAHLDNAKRLRARVEACDKLAVEQGLAEWYEILRAHHRREDEVRAENTRALHAKVA